MVAPTVLDETQDTRGVTRWRVFRWKVSYCQPLTCVFVARGDGVRVAQHWKAAGARFKPLF